MECCIEYVQYPSKKLPVSFFKMGVKMVDSYRLLSVIVYTVTLS